MRKLLLIIKREYLARILKRSFLLTTVLVPLIIYLVFFGLTVTDNSKILSIPGLIAAGIINISILIYSNQVMNGVIEEKSGKIIETALLSVKPFTLLLGKVIGTGLAGISQFTFWSYLGYIAATHAVNNQFLLNMELPYNPYVLTGLVLFYFSGGYFLYSALFIIIASVMKNGLKRQLLRILLTCPLLFSIVGLNDPSGNAGHWLSVIPLTSSAAMIIRLSMGGVHVNEIICSVVLLLFCFCLLSRVASKTYRMGMLTYNREHSFKDILRWILAKD